jgi:K+-sensing histidine kinase KdpD
VLLDDDGRVVVLNPAAVRMFDLRAKDELTGESFAALVPGWNAVASRIPVGRGGEAVPPAVVPLPGEGGASWIAASGQDAADGIVYTLRDVTEERRLEDMRDDIVAIVSHELRTPLTGVLGAAQTLVARGSELGEKLRADLALMIVEQSGRLARIVEEILLTRQLDSGELSFERGSFDVGERVSKVVAEAGTWRTSRLVDLDVAGAVHADADPSLFEQVLVNVLDNAFKYSPADQSIEIRVEPHRSNARVVVTDRGPGVAAVHHEAVFQKFLRLDPEHSSGVTGTGLGLYIARELARRMHGQVGILPSKIGAAFFIDLPLAHDDGVGSIPGA